MEWFETERVRFTSWVRGPERGEGWGLEGGGGGQRGEGGKGWWSVSHGVVRSRAVWEGVERQADERRDGLVTALRDDEARGERRGGKGLDVRWKPS